MQIAIPSLSAEGLVTDIRKKADLAMAHFFASDYSQTNVFYSDVTSLSYIVQRYGSDSLELKQQMTLQLEEYLGRNFTTVQVEVDVDEILPQNATKFNIKLDVVVTEGGFSYSLGKLVEIQNGKTIQIIDRLQNGDS